MRAEAPSISQRSTYSCMIFVKASTSLTLFKRKNQPSSQIQQGLIRKNSSFSLGTSKIRNKMLKISPIWQESRTHRQRFAYVPGVLILYVTKRARQSSSQLFRQSHGYQPCRSARSACQDPYEAGRLPSGPDRAHRNCRHQSVPHSPACPHADT